MHNKDVATDYRAEARKAARRYGLDPNIFTRQIQQESGFRADARSGAGALGIAQIMPGTAKAWGVDPLNPVAALNAAAKNMASYVKKYGGYENALRAYNAGPGAIQASRGYSETNHYVQTILGGRDPGGLGQPTGGGSSAPSSSSMAPIPGVPQLEDAGQAGDFTSLLASLVKPQQQAPTMAPIAPPQFSGQQALPQGFRALTPETQQAAPAQSGVSATLGLLESLKGSGPTVTTPEVAQAAGGVSIAEKVANERAGRLTLPKSGTNNWGVLDHVGQSGKYLQETYGIKEIGGYRASDPFPDHPSRKALDLMVYDDHDKGQAIAQDLIRNYKQHGIKYIIWDQRIWHPGKGWRKMEDRGSPTQNHKDHVHALYK
jgi:hypothetical protein